jgi:hypothetical protein
MRLFRIIRLVAVAACAITAGFLVNSSSYADASRPPSITLHEIDGGPNYFADINPKSAWMDHHILLGAWLEQPLNATEVGYDRATGDNIYWDIAGFGQTCGGKPCVAGFNVIRKGGMHVSAPGITKYSGAETVAFEGFDEADLKYGPGWGSWNDADHTCIPANSKCGYTVARWYFTGQPAGYGRPGYPTEDTVKQQGYSKALLFWETPKQAAEFLKFSDILSADTYWMTDGSLDEAPQGGCALFPDSPTICDHGSGLGLTDAERQLPANYAYNVTRLEQLQSINGSSKPIIVDIETGCPSRRTGACTTPSAMTAAAWHALIAGARGIVWFQHNFGGPCVDFRTIIDGSDKASSTYDCQLTPGVTEHDMVVALTKFNSEVNRLNSVLLAPFADGYVSSRDDVSYMAKYLNGSFYIFAASGKPGMPPPSNQQVSFSITGAHNCQVNVLNEGRTIPVTNGKFSDIFGNADSVRIYRVDC